MIHDDLLELGEVITEFRSVGEKISQLSLIKFELVNDVHWQELEFNLMIFGSGDPAVECPVMEIRLDPESLLVEGHQSQCVSVRKLSALFDEKLKETVKRMNVTVVSNQGDPTEKVIDLSSPGDDVLFPMPR